MSAEACRENFTQEMSELFAGRPFEIIAANARLYGEPEDGPLIGLRSMAFDAGPLGAKAVVSVIARRI